MKTKYIVMLVLLSLCLSACLNRSAKNPGLIEKRKVSFGVSLPLLGWNLKRFKGADLYFEHEKEAASIYLNSACEKISDSPLEALVAQIIIGLSEPKIIKEERLMLAQREALVTEMNAKIDGVPRFIKIMVLKKNTCVVDAVLSAPMDEPSLVADFDRLIQSLFVEAKL